MLSQQETTYSKGQCQWCKAIGQDATRPVNHCNVVLGVGVPADSVHPPGPPQAWLHTFTGDTPVFCNTCIGQPQAIKKEEHARRVQLFCTESAGTPTPRTTLQWFTGLVASCPTALHH